MIGFGRCIARSPSIGSGNFIGIARESELSPLFLVPTMPFAP
jgi:hypothetical protein